MHACTYANWIPHTGNVIRIHPNVKVVVFPTLHRVPSQGYAFVREQSLGLKAEYRHLSSRDLAQLRKQGAEVGWLGGWEGVGCMWRKKVGMLSVMLATACTQSLSLPLAVGLLQADLLTPHTTPPPTRH